MYGINAATSNCPCFLCTWYKRKFIDVDIENVDKEIRMEYSIFEKKRHKNHRRGSYFQFLLTFQFLHQYKSTFCIYFYAKRMYCNLEGLERLNHFSHCHVFRGSYRYADYLRQSKVTAQSAQRSIRLI